VEWLLGDVVNRLGDTFLDFGHPVALQCRNQNEELIA